LTLKFELQVTEKWAKKLKRKERLIEMVIIIIMK